MQNNNAMYDRNQRRKVIFVYKINCNVYEYKFWDTGNVGTIVPRNPKPEFVEEDPLIKNIL